MGTSLLGVCLALSLLAGGFWLSGVWLPWATSGMDYVSYNVQVLFKITSLLELVTNSYELTLRAPSV